MADNDRIHPHDEEKRNTIHWVDDGEGGMVYVDEYEEYLRQIEEEIREAEMLGEFDLGEVITTWKEDGEIEVNYGLIRGRKGTLLMHDAAPELSEEALSSWDVFLRFRDGQVEVMFGNVAKRTFLPDDNPHYYDGPLEGLFN